MDCRVSDASRWRGSCSALFTPPRCVSLVHFSVQSNHLHLIVEAADQSALSRAMQGLAIRLARRMNSASGDEVACSPIAIMRDLCALRGRCGALSSTSYTIIGI